MEDNIDIFFVKDQRKRLLLLKGKLINQIRNTSKEELHVPSDEIIEDGDQASTYLYQNVIFGLKERELRKLREIEYALLKIENGSYGVCEEYDIPIEKKRLEKMPWAYLCVEAAEEIERENSKKIG
jgi:DnaK suppressor protein